MKAKTILLFLFTLISFVTKAQDIREINVEKTGKFIKQVKREKKTINKLKLSGKVNEYDLDVLKQMSNLIYLDLSDLTFVSVKNSNFDVTLRLGYMIQDTHNTIVYAPSSQNSRFEAIDVYASKLYLPLGMKNYGRCDTVVINGVLDNIDDYDEVYERRINADVLIFEKKEYADKVNFCEFVDVDMVKILDSNWTYLNKWEKSRRITTEELRQIDAFGRDPFCYNSHSLPRKIILGDNVKELSISCFEHFTGEEIILNEGLKTINKYALPRLQYLKVPATVETFEFSNIETIEVTTSTPPKWLKTWSNHTVIIPYGCLSQYKDFNSSLKYIEKSKAK